MTLYLTPSNSPLLRFRPSFYHEPLTARRYKVLLSTFLPSISYPHTTLPILDSERTFGHPVSRTLHHREPQKTRSYVSARLLVYLLGLAFYCGLNKQVTWPNYISTSALPTNTGQKHSYTVKFIMPRVQKNQTVTARNVDIVGATVAQRKEDEDKKEDPFEEVELGTCIKPLIL